MESTGDILLELALVSVGGLLGFFLLLAELHVVKLSSGLTLSVAGIFKELLTVVSSAVLLAERLTPMNLAGLALCLCGIMYYGKLARSEEAEAAAESEQAEERAAATDSDVGKVVTPVASLVVPEVEMGSAESAQKI